jgi:hypothetical protein
MANKTHIDQLIDFKEDVIEMMVADKELMGLVFDDPNIDLDSDEVFNVRDTNIYDHSYSDETVQTDGVIILVETELVGILSKEINSFNIIIQVIVARNYMKLDTRRFKGLRGNRRDNVIRRIEMLLHDKRLSLGRLSLIDCGPVDVPRGFTSVRMVLSCDDFSRNRRLG